jgi:hypothetical protein
VARLYDNLPIWDGGSVSEWSTDGERPVVKESGPLWQTLLNLLQNDSRNDGIFQQ